MPLSSKKEQIISLEGILEGILGTKLLGIKVLEEDETVSSKKYKEKLREKCMREDFNFTRWLESYGASK